MPTTRRGVGGAFSMAPFVLIGCDLTCAGLTCAGLTCAGLTCAGLTCAGLSWAGGLGGEHGVEPLGQAVRHGGQGDGREQH